jgi:hypothetical protein
MDGGEVRASGMSGSGHGRRSQAIIAGRFISPNQIRINRGNKAPHPSPEPNAPPRNTPVQHPEATLSEAA